MKARHNHIDIVTLIAVMALMVISLGVVYSASSSWALEKWGGSGKLLGIHAVKVLIGFAAIVIFTRIDYHHYKKLTKPALLITLGVLAATFLLGGEVKGASRWLRFGGLGLQPSEFAKFALLFHLAVLLSEKKERVKDFKTGFLPMLVWIGSITALVLVQPNFSNGAMIFLISFMMLFVGGAKFTHVGLTFAALIPPLIGYMVLAPYRVQRMLNFFGSDGPSGRGNYQKVQGIIGFGVGGLLGIGPGESKQREFFLPESYGDFIFSIVGEEYGLLGTVAILALFLTILLRGLKIAKFARDDLGRYLSLGIVMALTVYALINAGVTLGLLPTTGLPMPFVSYGGSAMLFSCMAIGVMLNVSAQTDWHPRMAKISRTAQRPDGVPAPIAGQVY